MKSHALWGNGETFSKGRVYVEGADGGKLNLVQWSLNPAT